MSEQLTPTRPAPRARKRGRETVADMVRSLGLVMLLVLALWFFARPPASDSQAIRVVDPASDIAELRQAAPGIPAPTGLPPQWRATSSTPTDGALRIGYVTPTRQYAASTGASEQFLADTTGHGTEVGTFLVDGVSWRQFRDADDHTTLVRVVDGHAVTVGGARESTTLDELRTLAGATRS